MTDQLGRLRDAAARSQRIADLPPALQVSWAALEDEMEDLRVMPQEVVEHYHVAAGHAGYARLMGGRCASSLTVPTICART